LIYHNQQKMDGLIGS